MDLYTLFENNMGTGVLSTASSDGKVNSAIFARPHIRGNRALFVCLDRQNFENLQENPKAYYIFRIDGGGYRGVRMELLLREIRDDQAEVKSLRRRHKEIEEKEYTLDFEILHIFPLIGKSDED